MSTLNDLRLPPVMTKLSSCMLVKNNCISHMTAEGTGSPFLRTRMSSHCMRIRISKIGFTL
jgi:hypothetical protein